MHRRRLRLLAALLTLLLLTAACASKADESLLSADQTQTGDRETSPDSTEGDGNQANDTLDWEDCSFGECAELDVPVDYDQPDGPTLTLSIARAPAQGERIGALFVNPGGPGGTATDFVSAMEFSLPSDIVEHFDIVGVDPRGLGSSEIDCGDNPDPQELYGVDYSIDSPEDTTALLDVSQEYVDACEAAAGDLLPFLGTENVARDIDAVREAMGDEQLSYLGYSYGTAIGQMLAELFPDRIRAMVLDGVLELGPTGVELATDQAAGFETALQSYAEACNADDDCPLAPDAIGAIEQLQAQVEQAPIPADPRDLGPGELSTGLAFPLYDPTLWTSLSDAVANALDGDGSDMVDLADQYLSIASTDIYFAVGCLDSDWPDSADELLAAGKAAAAESPHFGEAIVNDYVRCAIWPAEEEPLPAVTAPGTPPILVVSTRNDPATPYEAGVRTADRLESGVLLTYEGDGHTVVGQGVECVDDAVTSYLVDLEPPEDGTTCE